MEWIAESICAKMVHVPFTSHADIDEDLEVHLRSGFWTQAGSVGEASYTVLRYFLRYQ